MLEFAVQYQTAIDSITGDQDMKMHELELDSGEWKLAKQLHNTLKVFKHAKLYFSCKTPSISTVIPVMNHIDEHLATTAENSHYSVALHSALAIGKQTLNKYYNKTNYSEVYQITMILHPRHKLKYFESTGWQEDWIVTAQSIVCNEFDRT
ncbi:hypothetical protein K443DRAFT_93909 [Laccaria amethystina LaAM-08-1]|uniref:hAT-like transposase RNase-H fold domain-containing protein n=1 Tax=Laccaria amethystina LaAM-08-1 TaxID=1095629 RepID=A0A0C9WWM2_9AGAR|nr:hypothetical protein K443DRAFT_93909 [Laccaria amethystina LaAM-08-1]